MSDNGHLTWTNERRKLSELIPWEENPRQSTKDQAKRIEGSIRKFGYSQPIEIEPDNTIIDGHQRDPVMTMMAEYGSEAEIDVRVASRKMTLDERKEYIALKHQGAMGEWNWEGMHNLYEGQELLEWGFDQKDLEFHGFDFGNEPAEDPGAQVDRAAELLEKWQVKTGDLWEIGAHRLICGDCTDPAVVERVMGGEKADYFVTDPPYVLQSASDKAKKADQNDQALRHFLRNCWLAVLPHMQSFAGAAWFCNWRTIDCVRTATRTRNEKNYQPAIWYKGKGATPGTPWMNSWEMILFYAISNFDSKHGTTGLDNFIHVQWGGGTRENHPAEKPVEIYEYAMTPMCRGNVVIDPFAGSGSGGIACERLGRKARMIELDPAYCAVALERLSQMGLEPKRIEGF